MNIYSSAEWYKVIKNIPGDNAEHLATVIASRCREAEKDTIELKNKLRAYLLRPSDDGHPSRPRLRAELNELL